MSFSFYDQNIYMYYQQSSGAQLENPESSLEEYSEVEDGDIIPPAFVLKQISRAFESGNTYASIKDMAVSRNSSPRERASLGFSALKSFMQLEKGDMFTSDLHDDEVFSFFRSILNAEGLNPSRKIGCFKENRSSSTMLSRDIHGAPPDCLVAKLAEIMGSFKTLHKMALFWSKFVAELRRLWMEEKYVPGIPEDAIPDLNCCLIYQKLQVMNCSRFRKKQNIANAGLLESLEREDGCHPDVARASNPTCYARLSTGELVLRLGAKHPVGNLKMLETGELIYAPYTQEGPLLTEDFIKENEELVLRTGSVGVGCSRLLSDMQAFKAANPGCTVEDFVRWYSPPDWSADSSDEGSQRGRLSSRMEKEGNLWQKMWENSKPVPAVRQVTLFDEDLAVEDILTDFENISPASLFKDLFLTLLSVGFVLAEATLYNNESFSRGFYECKEYVIAICEGDSWTEKIDDLCQVYESVEAMIVRPDEYLKMIKQRDENGEPNSPFQRLSLMFRRKNTSLRKSTSLKENKSLVEWPSFLAF